VNAVVEQGKFKFEDRETFGEYMQVLQRANQAIFADQKKLLQRIKDVKKAVKASQEAASPVPPAGDAAVSEGLNPEAAAGSAVVESASAA